MRKLKIFHRERKKKKNEKKNPKKTRKIKNLHLLDVLHDAADRDVAVLVAEGVDVDLVGAVEVLFLF